MRRESLTLTVGHENLRGFIVSVETTVRRGLFHFDIVGLATKTVSESKQRILSAVRNCEESIQSHTRKKIVTLLSPSDNKKEGAHFDLPIAVSYILATDPFTTDEIFEFLSRTVFIGELALSGSIRPVKNIDLLIGVAVQNGVKYIVLPSGNSTDMIRTSSLKVWQVDHLSDISEMIKSKNLKAIRGNFKTQSISEPRRDEAKKSSFLIDSIEGNLIAKRALLIALAGKHHVVFIGEPGTGKSLLAKSARELIPDVASASRHGQNPNFDKNNFRQPHHTSSYSDIVGSKKYIGEIALANKGILFLDELVEFDRRTLEALREPLENGYIQHKELGILYSDFILIGCMNPCGCGYYYSKSKKCLCARGQIDRYERKIQSPLFERIDLKINLRDSSASRSNTQQAARRGLENEQQTTRRISGQFIREAVLKVREIQRHRFEQLAAKIGIPGREYGAHIKEIKVAAITKYKEFLNMNEEAKRIFEEALASRNFSRRVENSTLLVARTIADVDESKEIAPEHILEALSYRNF